jgi:hypothetical protein
MPGVMRKKAREKKRRPRDKMRKTDKKGRNK